MHQTYLSGIERGTRNPTLLSPRQDRPGIGS
ncbi:hypothetical protein [Methylobacterium mesophilicum]